jgi:coenzyme F420-dependent glucose-6-phosphate dehydrogenase
MTRIAYQASHEQFSPSHLLTLVSLAEQAGFYTIHSSDHFHPWNVRQGQSGFSFAWLGAAMQATNLPYGVVCAPGQRYHPAIVAQAVATLGDMFPGRFHINLASGEAINESITGDKWPVKEERNARLKECAEVIRRLLAGEEVTHHGRVTMEHARLYTLPRVIPPLFGAALSKETAYWLGSWADGLVTVCQTPDKLKEILEAFRAGGGEHKPVHVKMDVSYAADEQQALEGAHDQWRTNIFGSTLMADITQVAQFEELAKCVKPEDMRQYVLVSSEFEAYVERIHQIAALGVHTIILHNVNRQQELFIEAFGKQVLPRVRDQS